MSKGEQCRNTLMKNVGCDGKDIVLMECDLSSLRSVKNFAEIYLNREERLDALICNAGIGRSSTKFTENKFDQVIQANYLGHFLLIDFLIKKLEECRPSRIIHVSSELHQGRIEPYNLLTDYYQFLLKLFDQSQMKIGQTYSIRKKIDHGLARIHNQNCFKFFRLCIVRKCF